MRGTAVSDGTWRIEIKGKLASSRLIRPPRELKLTVSLVHYSGSALATGLLGIDDIPCESEENLPGRYDGWHGCRSLADTYPNKVSPTKLALQTQWRTFR